MKLASRLHLVTRVIIRGSKPQLTLGIHDFVLNHGQRKLYVTFIFFFFFERLLRPRVCNVQSRNKFLQGYTYLSIYFLLTKLSFGKGKILISLFYPLFWMLFVFELLVSNCTPNLFTFTRTLNPYPQVC